QQVIVLFAGTNGYLDDIDVEQVQAFQKELLRFLSDSHPDIEKSIAKDKAVSEQTEKALRAAIDEFKKSSPLMQKPERPGAKAEAAAPRGGQLQSARRATERETDDDRDLPARPDRRINLSTAESTTVLELAALIWRKVRG